MNILAPSILSIDFNNMGRDIGRLLESGIEYIHVDVMDGMFVHNISFGPPVIKCVREAAGDAKLDVHLMIEEPIRYIDTFKKCGADMLTVHAEAAVHLDRTINAIREAGMRPAVAVNPATSIHVLDDILPLLDMVLIMTVNPGYGGQELIPYTLDKVRALKKEIDSRGLNVDIEVDGGVTADNISEVIKAGANVIVAGSSVFKGGNIEENVKELKAKL